jgi:ADP-ribose pyrophosphatase YjhB (NUDIX family)
MSALPWHAKSGPYDPKRAAKPVIKRSFGIACVRYNNIARQYEILMVRKRCTYAFISFVSGRYCLSNERTIMDLLNAMTNQEKLDVLSLDFDILWWRIWLARSHEYAAAHNLPLKSNPADSKDWTALYERRTLRQLMSTTQSATRQSLYIKKKAKFEKSFLQDSGVLLERLVRASTSSKNLMWDVPRGQKDGCESDLECAIREFGEETGVKPKDYRILYEMPPFKYSYTDAGVTYNDTFYIAVEENKILPRISFKTQSQIIEIDNISWMGITELRFLSCKKKLPGILIGIFNTAKKRCKSSKARPREELYTCFGEDEHRQLENCH